MEVLYSLPQTTTTTTVLAKQQQAAAAVSNTTTTTITTTVTTADVRGEWQVFWYDQQRQKQWQLGIPAFKQCKKKKCFYSDSFPTLWYKSPYKYDMTLSGKDIDENAIAEIKLLYADNYEEVKSANQSLHSTITKNQNFFTPMKKKKAASTHGAASAAEVEFDQQVHVGPFQLQVCSFKLERPVCMGIYVSIPTTTSGIENQSVCCLVSPTFTIKSKKPPQGGKKKKSGAEDDAADEELVATAQHDDEEHEKATKQKRPIAEISQTFTTAATTATTTTTTTAPASRMQKKPKLASIDVGKKSNHQKACLISSIDKQHQAQQQQSVEEFLSFINTENLNEVASKYEQQAQQMNLSLAQFLGSDFTDIFGNNTNTNANAASLPGTATTTTTTGFVPFSHFDADLQFGNNSNSGFGLNSAPVDAAKQLETDMISKFSTMNENSRISFLLTIANQFTSTERFLLQSKLNTLDAEEAKANANNNNNSAANSHVAPTSAPATVPQQQVQQQQEQQQHAPFVAPHEAAQPLQHVINHDTNSNPVPSSPFTPSSVAVMDFLL